MARCLRNVASMVDSPHLMSAGASGVRSTLLVGPAGVTPKLGGDIAGQLVAYRCKRVKRMSRRRPELRIQFVGIPLERDILVAKAAFSPPVYIKLNEPVETQLLVL